MHTRTHKSLYALAIFACVAGFLLFVPHVEAQSFLNDLNQQTDIFAGSQGVDAGDVSDPREIAARIVKYSLGILGILFTAYLILSGYYFLTAAGNDEQVNKAKSQMQTSVIGIIIVLSAYSLTLFIFRFESQQINRGNQGPIETEPNFDSCATGFNRPSTCP